jgi:hypothetical protein
MVAALTIRSTGTGPADGLTGIGGRKHARVAGFKKERGVDQKVRSFQGVASCLGQVQAYQTISSSRALSVMLKNQ